MEARSRAQNGRVQGARGLSSGRGSRARGWTGGVRGAQSIPSEELWPRPDAARPAPCRGWDLRGSAGPAHLRLHVFGTAAIRLARAFRDGGKVPVLRVSLFMNKSVSIE